MATPILTIPTQTPSRVTTRNIPGFRVPEATQAAQSVAAAPMAAKQQAETKVAQAYDKEMALAFKNLLQMGLEGAQAYVQDVKGIDEEVGAMAEGRLASLAPIWADPKLSGETIQRTLVNLYQGVDTMLKNKLDPTYEQKLNMQQDKQIETYKEKLGIAREEAKKGERKKWETDIANLQKFLPSYMKKTGEELTRQKPQLKLPDVETSLKTAQDELKALEDKLEKAESRTKTQKFLGTSPFHAPYGWIQNLFETKKEDVDKKKEEVNKLQKILESAEKGELAEEGLTPGQRAKLGKVYEEYNKRKTAWDKLVANALEDVNREIKGVGGTAITSEELMSGAMPKMPTEYPGSYASGGTAGGVPGAGETASTGNLRKAKATDINGNIHDVLVDENGTVVQQLN